ncbi:SDR family oxidoreductase [Nocardiopsis akebiae]|uniref:SDR family oxidoreductase n=1 Tax=Nocardiopsis akebiae TaxID=2831968 RepID=A0ABX8C0G8_9ACTN|nr:SDR family oxidoreductase [Nocardiopsis akebiae]QUX26939.1 SDR family oxidoreductase [Nocardiopsis akebiae]
MSSDTVRVVVVSGASGTIGRACVRRLADEGTAVVAGYHRGDDAVREVRAEAEERGATCVPVRADVSEPGGAEKLVEAATERFGRVDGCVAAAAVLLRRPALTTDAATLDHLMRVNVGGSVALARACLRPMMRARRGRIVLFGSWAGQRGLPGQSAYAASKGALEPWAASVAGEVGRQGVTVNVVAPGVVDDGSPRHGAEEAARVRELIGARRPAELEEVTAAVSFLLSEGASYVNGTTLRVDGGARF